VAELALGAPYAAQPRTGSFWIAPPLLILAALFFFPLWLILRQALAGDGDVLSLAKFAGVMASGEFRHALVNTLVIALSATAGCLVLGFVLSVLIAFTPSRCRRSWSRSRSPSSTARPAC
jgi:2-aminoethylphosphonate transport system permease protein